MDKAEHEEAMGHNEMCVYVCWLFCVHIMFNSCVKFEKFGAPSK